MKKIITMTVMTILVSNAFSAQILNNKNNLIYGDFNQMFYF